MENAPTANGLTSGIKAEAVPVVPQRTLAAITHKIALRLDLFCSIIATSNVIMNNIIIESYRLLFMQIRRFACLVRRVLIWKGQCQNI